MTVEKDNQPEQKQHTITSTNLFTGTIDKSTIPGIAGFTAGVVSTTLLLPLDIVKVRLQVTESSLTGVNKPTVLFRSFRIFGGILKYEGIRGLYQGWVPSVIGSAISWGGYFYIYEQFKQQIIQYKVSKNNNNNNLSTISQSTISSNADVLTSIDNFLIAVSSSIIMVGITNPIWLIKTRIQLQMNRTSTCSVTGNQIIQQPYKNMIDAFRTIIQDEGFMALYKGIGPALLLTSHGGVQFVVYEALRKHYNYTTRVSNSNKNNKDNNDSINKNNTQANSNSDSNSSSIWKRMQLSAGYLTMGAVSKLVATTVTYPIQLIKARIQQRHDTAIVELTEEGKVIIVTKKSSIYSSIRSTCYHIYTTDGISGFFKGCIPNAIRVMPAAAITFLVYEEVSDFLYLYQ